MPIPNNLFTRRTDKLIENLKADEGLDDGLPVPVEIFKGVHQLKTQNHVIFVYRRGVTDYLYTQGIAQVDVDGVWTFACLTRHIGDPAQLEDYVSILAANVIAHIAEHKQEPTYWLTLEAGPHEAVSARDELNQYWELERIPVLMTFSEEIY